MEAAKRCTLEERIESLIWDRLDDVITEGRGEGFLRVQQARDAWLEERLGAQDFEEYRKRYYFGPAGDEFPRGGEQAEIQAEMELLQTAYRQGIRDGARLLAMVLGLQNFPGEGTQ